MKLKRSILASIIIILSTGFLFGSSTANDQEPDLTKKLSEQHNHGENGLEKQQNETH